MSYIDTRYEYRFQHSKQILRTASDDIVDYLETSAAERDFGQRLEQTPRFIWEELFKAGLNPENFWDEALRVVRTELSISLTHEKLDELTDLCHPVNRHEQHLDLNTIRRPNRVIQCTLGHLGEKFTRMQQAAYSDMAENVLSYLGTRELPLLGYHEDLVKGRFPVTDIMGISRAYTLPTAIDGVEAQLIYVRQSSFPLSRINVHPLTP